MLILDPDPPLLRWCKRERSGQAQGEVHFDAGWSDALSSKIGSLKRVRAVAYVLYHGGEAINKPMTLLSEAVLLKLANTIRYQPEANDITFKAAKYGLENLPKIPHLLFCDTAFFANLPLEASTYAVPFELRKKGVRKYGGYGLCHQWAWESAYSHFDVPVRKIVSVFLGNRPNMAAIRDGSPLDTTMGFTPIEGMPSATGCGDIDPTIVFQLNSAGLSFEEIDRLLTRKSGFSGLLGRKCTLSDLFGAPAKSDRAAVREIFRYHVVKNIGAMLSVLGGTDAIVFAAENLADALPFVGELCRALEFLGVRCLPPLDAATDLCDLTEDGSSMKILCLRYNKWDIMADKAVPLIQQGARKNAGRKKIPR